MNNHSQCRVIGRLVLLGTVCLAACADLEREKSPLVSTTGPNSVVVGATIQVSAATANAVDTSYSWVSERPEVATVDAAGAVTGVTLGEAIIRVVGDQSAAIGRHVVVVVAELAGPPDFGAVPSYEAWLSSPHADTTSEAFNHWNEDGSVPVECARCHSPAGYLDYLGGDGTPSGVVDNPAAIGGVVDCETCHNAATTALTSVTFPSGVTVDGLGPEARCMTCHQGRASGADVDALVSAQGLTDPDQSDPDLGFLNVHYYPAAATLYAGVAQGGYQYPTQVYDVRFRHVPGLDSCVGCHDPHTAQVRFDVCATCHQGATDRDSVRNIRMIASRNQDYDGDNNRTEGIYGEIQGLKDILYAAIQRYGSERSARLCYGAAYPYWFKDSDGDGACSASESTFPNGYASWTPRLLRAAYNYQMMAVDPGNFAHNGKYVIQLLHDSIVDLNDGLTADTNVTNLVREDVGHFNGAAQAFRNWDSNAEGVVASCSRCHGGAEGFRFFTQFGVGKSVPEQDNGLECSTCHDTFGLEGQAGAFAVNVPTLVYLPGSAVTTSFDPTPSDGDAGSENNDNLCANCHIGRQSKATIDAAIAAAPPSGPSSFLNVHYFPAAGTRAGTTLKIGYEFTGPTYSGPLIHPPGLGDRAECTSCHDPVTSNHTFAISDVWETRCAVCHSNDDGPDEIRGALRTADYDGDGNVAESLKSEIQGLQARLLAELRTRAAALSRSICYNEDRHPYFFNDAAPPNPSGTCGSEDTARFSPWPADLLRAAHNYQLSVKDPGSYAHNFSYTAQLLIDSIDHLGGDVSGLSRPAP